MAGSVGRVKRLERLVAIGEALRRAAPRPVSAARLAEDFGVSRRTIERDLAALRNAGAPLYAERGRSGGHVSLDQPGNTVVSLSPNEVVALLVATAVGGPDMPWADAAATATGRLLDGLPTTTRLGVEQLRDQVRTRAPDAAGARPRIRRSLEAAVERATIVNITYVDGHQRQTVRSVEAVGFYRGIDHWHLIGWCHLRQAGRIFRLDRIERANLTRRPNQPHDIDEVLGWVPDEVAPP